MSKCVLNMFCGNFFENFLSPVFHRGSRLRKFSKKFKKGQTSKNVQNRSQKYPNVFWTSYGANFSKIFAQFSMECRVFESFRKKSKIFQNCKNAQNRSQKYPNVFWTSFGANFSKIFAQFSMECRVFGSFRKKSKNFQNSHQKRTKRFPKESKSVLNMFWGNFFEKILPSFPWKVESSKFFKKNQKNFKIPKMPKIVPKSIPKSFPKVSKLVLNVFWGNFFEKLLPSVPWKVESAKNFKKIKKVSKFQKCPKSFPKVSKRVLNNKCSMEARDFSSKIFLTSVSMELETSKILKKVKNFSKLQISPKSFPKLFQMCFEHVLAQCFHRDFEKIS